MESDAIFANGDTHSDTAEDIQSKQSISDNGSAQIAQELKTIIANEIGIPPHASFSDLGVDSMLTLSIIDSFRSRTGQNIPANFFISYPTLASIQAFFEPKTQTTPQVPPLAQSKAGIATSVSSKAFQSTEKALPPRQVIQQSTSNTPPARCSITLLQLPVKANVNSPSLILLPDGAGSPAPYTVLPTLHPSFRVLGLSSPFLTNQSTYNLSLVEISTIFSNTIMHAAPTDPLVLGGLSIGGVFAHEVAKQLLEKGRTVRGLLLLDTPCPQTVPAITPSLLLPMIDVLQELGRFKRPGRKDAKLPPNAREHFLRNAIALERHHPSPPCAAARRIPCVAIWATRGALDSLDKAEVSKVEAALPGDSPGRDWLLKKRSMAGAQGWQDCFDDEVWCEMIDADHFSFFKEAHVSTALIAIPISSSSP